MDENPYHPTPALIQVHLISQHHEWEVFGVRWAGLHMKTFMRNITHGSDGLACMYQHLWRALLMMCIQQMHSGIL